LTEPTIPTILLGDFNINPIQETTEQKAQKAFLITNRGYTQLINQYTTDYRTQIDHIYTNIPQHVQSAGTLESYCSDHKPIFPCKLSEDITLQKNFACTPEPQ